MSLSLADVYAQDSDSEDEEYIPDGRASSERSEEDDDSELSPSDGNPVPVKKRKVKSTSSRKRRRGPKFKGSKEGVEEEGGKEESDEEEEDEQEKLVKEVEEKERIDNLWASFKQETESSSELESKGKVSSQTKKIKIQKTYDFAGEEVTVEREVDADSKEAKDLLKSETEEDTSKPEEMLSMDAAEMPSNSKQPPQEILGKATVSSKTRPSGLSSVLKTLGKKTKMNTLEKSNLDWLKYKQEEGLEEELARNLKDGYLEKQDFLQRSDQRQFELEREQRLKRFKRMH